MSKKQKSRIQLVEMWYAGDVNRMGGEDNVYMYGKFGMFRKGQKNDPTKEWEEMRWQGYVWIRQMM